MLEWMKRRGLSAPSQAKREVDATPRHASRTAGRYRLLYEYLEHRYAISVVLTFGQIEDLLGFTLPDVARIDPEWWTATDLGTAEVQCSDAWTLASRTAKPNLLAQTVLFERVS